VSQNRKDSANKLVNALWAYRTAYKTPLGMSPYRAVYGKPCHLLVEIEYRAWCTIKMLNYDLTDAGEECRLQLNELEEIKLKHMRVLNPTKREPSCFMISIFLGKSLPWE